MLMLRLRLSGGRSHSSDSSEEDAYGSCAEIISASATKSKNDVVQRRSIEGNMYQQLYQTPNIFHVIAAADVVGPSTYLTDTVEVLHRLIYMN